MASTSAVASGPRRDSHIIHSLRILYFDLPVSYGEQFPKFFRIHLHHSWLPQWSFIMFIVCRTVPGLGPPIPLTFFAPRLYSTLSHFDFTCPPYTFSACATIVSVSVSSPFAYGVPRPPSHAAEALRSRISYVTRDFYASGARPKRGTKMRSAVLIVHAISSTA